MSSNELLIDVIMVITPVVLKIALAAETGLAEGVMFVVY
jgi:hypothetical protein